MSSKILIVDDEATIRASLVESLTREGYEISSAETGEEALAKCHSSKFDLVITDLKLPGVSGLEILQALRNQGKGTPVIMMTAYGDVDTAVNAMRFGAYDFIPKPFKLGTMKSQVRAALKATNIAEPEKPAQEEKASPAKKTASIAPTPEFEGQYMGMIKACPGLAHIANILEKVGGSRSGNDTTILIQGESGSGKEIVARAVHEISRGSRERFMEINCSALPESLLESELFGHEKGSFTDAKNRKEGLFELAGGGSIFLDEIGDIPLSVQVKLLRVLEEKMIQRVGTNTSIPIDVRIITATNKNLEKLIAQGIFREDLLFRINVFPLTCPPLRQRKDDITLIIQHFITLHAEKTGKNILGFTPEAMRLMVAYPWPGNIREMRNSVEYGFVLARGKSIGIEHLPEKIINFNSLELENKPLRMVEQDSMVKIGLSEKENLFNALKQADGNQTRAAKILGVSRITVWKRIKKHGIQLK